MKPGATTKTAMVAIVLAVLVPLPMVANATVTYLFVDFFVMALFAASYNVVFGMAGLLSFCHAAFYGAGAYAVAMSATLFGRSVILGFVLAPVLSGLLALVMGWIAVRVKGIQFAMLTLALGQLVHTLVVRQYHLTGGDDGLPIEPPSWLTSVVTLYYLAFGVGVVCLWLLWRLRHSPFGTALAAIRQNPQRALFIGLNVKSYELAAFVLSGAVAGLAGALRGIEQQAAYPTLFAWTQSAEPLLMTLAGGLSTFLGPIIGAGLFVVLNFFITKGFDYPLLVFGLVILAIVLFLPGGVASLLARPKTVPSSAGS